MEVRILGPLEVRHDDAVACLTGSKPRALLSLLCLRPNRPHSADELIDQLWEGTPPASAQTALRVHIAKVRQVLEVGRALHAPSRRVPFVAGGYILRLEPDELDAQRFERALGAARDANASGDPGRAVESATAALDMWRGPPLEEIDGLVVGQAEIARLEDLWASAVEELAEARLALGQAALVADVLTAASELQPLRERLVALFMTALYRCGRQADALAAYSRLAQHLDDQLAVRPSTELRQLEEDILLQRPHLLAVAQDATTARQLVQSRPTRFIGRREELSRLLELHTAGATSGRRVVLLSGPAGIGKTTLVERFRTNVECDGTAEMLVGRCTEQPASNYEPIVEVVKQLVDSGDATVSAELSLILAPAIRRTASLVAGDAEAARYRLFEAIVGVLRARMAQAPTLVFEDVHWADRSTLILLRYLLRHKDLDHLMVVVTFRDDDMDPLCAEALDTIAAPSALHRIRLDGLNATEVRAFIRAVAPPESVPALVESTAALQNATAGNPLFLRELIRDIDTQAATLEDDLLTATLDLPTPPVVRDVLDRRMAGLTEAAQSVLAAAAVLAHGITAELLCDITRFDEDDVVDALEECLVARILVEDEVDLGRYAFGHSLLQSAVLARLPRAQVASVHLAVAIALDRAPSLLRSSSEVARHLLAAEEFAQARLTKTYARQAADDAAARYAWHEAAYWYGETLRCGEADDACGEERGRLEFGLAVALENDQQARHAREHFRAAAASARRAGDMGLFADVALAAYGPSASGSDFTPEARCLLEEALAGTSEDEHDRRVQLLNGIASASYYIDPEREGEAARRALTIALKSTKPSSVATAKLALRRWYTHEPAARVARLALTESALETVRPDLDDGHVYLNVARALVADRLENGDIAGFTKNLGDYERNAVALGSPRHIYFAMTYRATEATMRGDLALGDQLARGAALRGEELEDNTAGTYLLQRFVIRFQQARLHEEMSSLRASARENTVFRAGASLRAVADAETGRPGEAVDLMRRMLGRDGQWLPRDAYWLGAIALFADAAAACADRELVELLSELLEPCAAHVVIFGTAAAVLGFGHHSLARMALSRGDASAALLHAEAAMEAADQSGMPYWGAQARVDLAHALMLRGRAGDASKAAGYLALATRTAQQSGYGRIRAAACGLA